MKGTKFESNYSILVLPKPVENQFKIKVKPTFDLIGYSLFQSVIIGDAWKLDLPKTQHLQNLDVYYYKVERGSAFLFMDFDQTLSMLYIAANTTSEINLGTY